MTESSPIDGDIWPNFLVIGAPKAGTTSLYHYLSQHPDVFLSRVRKEGRFFSGVGQGQVYWPDFYHFDTAPEISDYQALMADYSGQARVGDVSPDYYAYASLAAPRARELCGPDTRIIALLRNPVDRTYSHYLQNVRRDAEFLSFEKALEDQPRRIAENWGFQWLYAHTSTYPERLKIWQAHFPNMLVLLQDDLDADGPVTVAQIVDFLGLPQHPITVEARYNTGGIPAAKKMIIDGHFDDRIGEDFDRLHAELIAPVSGTTSAKTADGVYPPLDNTPVSIPPMASDMRARLQTQFEPSIREVEALLGRSLDVWRK